MKASFSLSSLRCASPIPSSLGDNQENDRQLRHLSLPRSKRRDQWQRSWENKDEFWEALQTNYNYLMNEELITTCKAANGELDEEESSLIWPYQDFLREYTELIQWLKKIESEFQKAKSENSVESLDGLEQQMINNAGRRKNFNEQAHRLKDRYPDVKSEIHDKISELNNIWDTLAHNIFPRKPREETIAIKEEIECRLRCLRKWLRDMENRLHLSCIQPGLALEDIQEMMIQQQTLQREIEACNGFAAVAKLLGRLLGYFLPEPEAGCGADSPERTRHAHLDRVARNLERHWHDLWLRSLEKQCALEQLLGSQGLDCSCTSLNSSCCDEPLTKFPRLGGSGRRLSEQVLEEDKRRRQEDHDEDRHEELVLKDCSSEGHREDKKKKAKRGRKESKDAATECGPNPAVSSKGVMVRQRSMALPESLAASRIEPVDVGYSSESSTHLSNDEGLRGESVRVYTYPTPDNTKPHILDEVVLDDGHSRRKQNDVENGNGDEDDDEDITLQETLEDQYEENSRGANCGTFYFRHVDTDQSDMEGHHKKAEAKKSSAARRLALEDAVADRVDTSELDSEWAPSLIFSEEDIEEGWEYNFEDLPIVSQAIRKLVDKADDMVRRSSRNGSNPVSVYNSSCDASCESTSSDGDAEGDADDHKCVEKVDALVGATSEQQQPVVLRANASGKKRGADRPWSVGESIRRSQEYAEGVQQSIMSASEGALDRITSHSDNLETGNLEDWPSTSTKVSVSSVRRRRRRRSRLLTDSQCSSDGTSVSANTAVGLGSDPTASPRRRRWSQTASSNNTSRSHSHSRSVATDADSCPPPLGEPDLGEMTAATDGHISSHSEQASWDDYQEGLYPSEHYSEQELDDAALWRLMNFGDDYRACLESQSDGNSTPCCCVPMGAFNFRHPQNEHLVVKQHRQHFHHHNNHHHPAAVFGGKLQTALRNPLDSDSDADDLDHVMKATGRNLREIKNILLLPGDGDFSAPVNRHYNEVLATCKTNLECLQSVLKGFGERQEGSNVVHNIKVYIHEWQTMTEEAQQQQKYLQCLIGFQKELSSLVGDIRALGYKVDGSLQTRHQLECDIAALKCNLKILEEKNKTLVALNANVNSFVNETGKDVKHLKKEVSNCYDLWHGSHSKMKVKIDELMRLHVLWGKLDKELEQLKVVLDRDDGTMKSMADILNRSTKRSKVDKKLWQQIASAKDISDIVAMVRSSEGGIALSGFLVDSAGYEESFTSVKAHLSEMRALLGVDGLATFAYFEERVRNVDAHVAKQKLTKETLQLQVATLLEKSESLTKEKARGVEGKCASGEKPRRSRLWRMLRAALPIQLAVVLLLCIACLLEPRCCDSVNNLNLSLTPQLRYVRGPPPI